MNRLLAAMNAHDLDAFAPTYRSMSPAMPAEASIHSCAAASAAMHERYDDVDRRPLLVDDR
jgi:hypothetical protein